jgi:acylphosphatase
MIVCKHVLYSGHVQGIGFRSTAKWYARTYSVAGHVRNLPSGEVELVAEGEDKNVETLLAAVAQQMAGYIRKTTIQDVAPTGQSGFQILK